MNFARSIALILLPLCSAWAAPHFGRPDVTCNLTDPTSGLIVVSSTAPTSGRAVDPTGIWFHFNQVGRSQFSNEKIYIAPELVVQKVTSDFPGTFGRLYVLKLKAGDYEFRKWSFTQGLPGERTNVKSPKPLPSVLPFKVTAGHITYLGSFSPEMADDHNLSVTLYDQSKRDIEVLGQKCPNVDVSKVDTELLKLGKWE